MSGGRRFLAIEFQVAMYLTQFAETLYNALLTLAYPQACIICGQSIERREYVPACADCWHSTRVFTGEEPICWRCGVVALPHLNAAEREQIRCRRCDNQLFEVARACGVYEGALRESILLLKRQPQLSGHLIKLAVAAAKRPPLDASTRIIPVPLHPERELQRGFNQAAVIARALAPSLDLVLDEISLTRINASPKYRAGLDSKGRFDTVAEAFEVRLPRLIEGETVLLVDDVFTTGATASSCAQALLSAGAKAVRVLTLARPAW
jgi:competence protein ComFC